MIGQLTELSIHTTQFALAYEQLAWPQTEKEFLRLREEANRLLSRMEIDAKIPETQEQYLAERKSLNGKVLMKLGDARQRILGDTVALPLFFLHSLVYRVAVTAPLGLDWQEDREIIEDCLEDLGVTREGISHLDREIGWVFVRTEQSGETTVGRADAIRAAWSFLQRVFEEFAHNENSIQGNRQVVALLGELRGDVREFREEYQQDAQCLKKLLEERDSEIVSAVREIQAHLISAGIEKPEAIAMTETSPEGFWDRITRWASGAPWGNIAEEALWAALDFVPGGTGVKLGIKVSRAVRKGMQKH